MNSKHIQQQIESLIPKAETGEQWAEICLLETKLVQANKLCPRCNQPPHMVDRGDGCQDPYCPCVEFFE